MVRFLNEIVAALEVDPDSTARSGPFVRVEPIEMPEPCRSLLVHNRDMTGTLERFFESPIHIEPLLVRRDGDDLCREVVLVAASNGKTRRVEAGAIRIRLAAFPEAARCAVLESRTPLGAILVEHEIPFQSHPRGYFRTTTNDFLRQAFPDDPDGTHYGRHNVLSLSDGTVLAEVVEILPAV